MNPLVNQISNIWQSTSLAQRIIFALLFMGFAVGIIGVAHWVRKPEYGLLYTDLGQKEASEVISVLQSNDVPYKIKSGGTILVPSNMIHEARMNLAKDGLPSGIVGFELFDEVKFGMSNLAQKVNYRRALQGELSKALSHLDGVEWARIQIVIPEPSLFIEEETPSTASVIIKMKNGRRIKPLQLSGITHLVSASVEGLTPDNITITDNFGNLLSQADDSTITGIVSSQLDLRRKIEDYYSAKALSMVEKITGQGKAIVKISADLDFKQINEKQIEYDNENKVPISHTITSQSTEMPQANGGEGGGKSSKEKEEKETTQYALSKVERAISNYGAQIKRLTVAVLVDGTYEEVTEDGKVVRNFIKRPTSELNQIASIVKKSIGLDETAPRNDTFEIQCIQFKSLSPVFVDLESIAKEDKKEFILLIVKNSSLVITVIAFLLFAAKALKRLGGGGHADYASYAPSELGSANYASDDADKAESAKLANEKRVELRDGIIQETKGDPRTTSNLIRKWLREGDH